MELTAVIKAHPEYLGERHKGETTLPILVKLIDARKDLSVQVHPDDDYAKMKEHGQLGKTEMPVPTVSFATRYLHTSAGVMVTASHNPGKYNGYKVYGADGCQITTEAAAEILAEIEKLDIFADVKTSNFEAGVANGSIRYIPDEVYTAFVEQVKSQSVLFGENVNKNVAIVYSPLNGTGLKPVTRTLQEMGYTNITVVKEQEQPDGYFPTCPYPNPEIKEAMALGISLLDRLDELYKTYGYCLNTLHSYEFDGSAGFARMQSIMQAFRGGIKEFGGKKVVRLLDYVQGLDGLPKSDVLKFLLEDNCSLVVRPSGTEPKLKIYISVSAENKEMAEEVEDEIAKTAEKWIC